MTNLLNENQSFGNTLPASFQEADSEFSFLDLLQPVVDNLRLLVLGPLAVGVVAFGLAFLIPPTYTAKTQFVPPQQQQSTAASMLASLGTLGGLAGAVSAIKNPADQFLAYMKSVTLQNALIERFKLKERYDEKTMIETRKALTEKVRATSGKDGLISVEVDDKDPQFAADLANAHVEELAKLLGKLAVTEAQQRRLFFEKQLLKAKDKLTHAEIELKATGIAGSVLKSNPTSAIATVAALQAQVTAQEVKVGAMRGYYAENAPDFKQALKELINLRAQLSKQEQSVPTGGKASIEADYVTKFRDFKYQETLFELFAKQYEMAKVDEAREGAVIQVLDLAHAPEKKAKPQKALIAIIATFTTGFALLLLVFVRQALSNAGQREGSTHRLAALKVSWHRALGKAG